jgi:hypothetical protein
MYEIVKIQMHFQSNYLIFWLNFFNRCVDFGKTFSIEIYLFSIEQSIKKIMMVKVEHFCMGQRMMWDNVVNLSNIFCQKVQLCKLCN